ncbi:MAG: fatty acid oxidation complex subunit alpha FadJ [Gemmatimonadetes bacterium]|nr:fatty acid oxidation complex subunit alpha FadJ [Gemmatimonadota bacterium]
MTTSVLTVEVLDGIAVLTLDIPGQPQNVLGAAVRAELAPVMERLQKDTSIKAAVLLSGKKDSWIAGADIDELQAAPSGAALAALARQGHALLKQIEGGRVPVVAAINGTCMGGGLEIALACRYRIGTEYPKTTLALPEVQLGLCPGLGGTQRLPRLVGLQAALDMMLTGKNIRARKALQMGLVNELVHPAILREVAIRRARDLYEGRPIPPTSKSGKGVGVLLLEENPVGRSVIFRKARESVLEKTRGNYPAPPAILDVVHEGYAHGIEAGYARELETFARLAETPESRALISIFFATTALKKDPGVDGDAPAPAPITKLGILGSGFMGAGIAAVSVMQGIPVRMKDAQHERVLKGVAAVRDVLREKLVRKQVTRQEYDDQLSLLSGTITYDGFGNAPLVIEAVFEDLDVKHQVVRELEPVVPHDAIIASNTSTIPIADIAQVATRPENVIGLHFFSPVHKMPLLEIIVTPKTSARAITTSVAYGKRIGKTCIIVNDAPGFYVNRILAPYINEAGKLLDEGAAIDAIDHAMLDFGFPVGPITLLDEVGLDIAGKSGKIMLEAFGDRMSPSKSLQRVLEAGRLGRKGKSGFYRYGETGKKEGVDESVYALLPTGNTRSSVPAEEIQWRCALAMLNEAARCLEEGIVRSARDGDIGAIFGIGFPPFRGGPFRYMDAIGADEVVRRLEELHDRFRPRFEPCNLLLDMARNDARFHSGVRA